jgi:hypothetical protein
MKLLIAEDDAFFRKLLEQIVASEYELVLAENGEEPGQSAKEGRSPPGNPPWVDVRNDWATSLS